MQITKCDKCKKNIDDQKISVWLGYMTRVELCKDCGKPIEQFLRKNKLAKDPIGEFQKKR